MEMRVAFGFVHHSTIDQHDLTCAGLVSLKNQRFLMTIPFGENSPSEEPSSALFTPRLRKWLEERLNLLARQQRIQDARALRSEFSIEELFTRWPNHFQIKAAWPRTNLCLPEHDQNPSRFDTKPRHQFCYCSVSFYLTFQRHEQRFSKDLRSCRIGLGQGAVDQFHAECLSHEWANLPRLWASVPAIRAAQQFDWELPAFCF